MGADGQSDFEIVGVRGLTKDREALVLLDRQLTPICAPACSTGRGEVEIASEITKTLAVTAGREKGRNNDDIALEVLVDELGKYPLDCVKRALGAWRRNEKWRPTLADLLKDVEWRAKPRMVALAAVRAALETAT